MNKNSVFLDKKLFWVILILAFILRFYRLGEIPLSLDWDETSNAYNAYSILKTGRDEYGLFLPITNRSFEDYKPPLYMYLNIPTVAVFGLTAFAARLPSAIFGFLTVPIIYFLAKKLFVGSKYQFSIFPSKTRLASGGNFQFSIADISALLLAISPWHIQFSRVGFEATVGLFFAVSAITAFLYGLNNKKWLIAAGILLGISAYSYHTERIFVPLLFMAAFIIYKKEILAISKKYLAAFAIITILIGLPLVLLIPPKVILQRFEVTTGRPRLEDIEKSIRFILEDHEQNIQFGEIIHNRRLIIGQTYLGNYLSHFDFNFLFTKGDDNFRHHIGGIGMFYLFELPLFLYGIYLLVKKRTGQSLFLLSWLLLSPVAASPATPNPHANRALPMVVAFEIIAAFAFVSIFLTDFKFKKQVLSLFSLWIIFSLAIYLHNYYVHYPIDKASFWQYGYSQAALESVKLKDQFEKINVDHSIEQAYIFWLFNTGYDPASYQRLGTRNHFDKYYFDAKPPTNPAELFIADTGNFPGGFKVIKTIYYPDGSQALKIGHPR